MIILAFLILIVPALIAVLLYERFRATELIMRKRVELTLLFAFLINFIGYVVLWLRGNTFFYWDFAVPEAEISRVSFVVQYMLVSLVASVVLAYVLSLVRVGKKADSKDEEATEAIDEAQTDE